MYANLDDLVARTELEIEYGDDPSYVPPMVEGEFLPECMNLLRDIIERTGASIVLSSTWRESPCQRRIVASQFQAHGISQHRLISFTPISPSSSTRTRSREIKEWIQVHGFHGPYVVIDDYDLTQEEDGFSISHDHMVTCDGKKGLQLADADRATGILKGKID